MSVLGNKPAWIVSGVLLLAFGSVLTARLFYQEGGDRRQRRDELLAPVEVAEVRRGALSLHRTFSGTIEPQAQITVAAKVAGRVQRLHADVSDPVSRGQTVAHLDDAEFSQSVVEADARLAVAEANRVVANSRLEVAQREVDRTKTLHARGIASDSDLDSARAEFLAGQAAVKVAEANLKREQAALTGAEIRLGYTQVTADWAQGDDDRVVAERFANEGNTVAANTALYSIVELDPVLAVIQVTEKDYPRLVIGQQARVQTDAFPDRVFDGTVSRIAPIFRAASRQARVELNVPNPDYLLKPGMFARCQLELERVENAVSVPELALTRRDNEYGVFLVSDDGGSVKWVEVEPGIREGSQVQLVGTGITGRVVTIGQQLVKDGSAVRIAQEDGVQGGSKKPAVSLPAFSVNRPVFTTMVTMMVIILGLASFSRLQIDLLPDIELPTLTIRTGYQGAGPVVMEQLITQIIEEIIATVPGVTELTSESSEGRSQVRVTFNWGTDIDTAAIDVQAQLEDEISELPDDIVRPRVSKFDVASYPVVIMGISSPMDPVRLTRIIDTQLRLRFARIPGVAQIDTWGAYSREVRIELDPERIKALGVPFNDVLSSVRDSNLDLPTGNIEQGRYEVTLRAPAEYVDLEQIRNTVVAEREGGLVTLGQIADVRDTHEKRNRIIRLNGDPGLRVAIRKQPGANTVEVADRVLAEIEEINRDYPQVRVVPVTNQGNFIERSIHNVAQSVLYGGSLAIIVLLFFLRNVRSTVVISLAIPISLIATFAMIFFGGLTINLMTLGGLALGVGMMVDSSVVVLENIFRRRAEYNEQPRVAAIEGAREVSSAILASTLTTLVIFLPLIFLRGVSGLIFKELAFTVMFALACSLLVSLSLVPMLASKLLKAPAEQRKGPPWLTRLAARSDSAFRALDNNYAKLLRGALQHRWLVVFASVGLLGASLLLLPMIGSEFLPPSDEGEVRVSGEMEIGTRLDLVDAQTRKLEDIVLPAVPELVSSVTSVGGRSGNATGEIRMSLTPAAERTRSNQDIADDLRRRLDGRIPGMKIRTRAPQGQFLLERILGGDEGITVEVRGFDLATLEYLGKQVAAAVEGVDGITDVDFSRKAGIPQQEILVDRAKVADLGLTPRDVTEALETAIAGSKASEFRSEGQSYRILVQLKDAERRSLEEVLDLVLTTRNGEQVALRNLVSTAPSRGPVVISRKDQQRIVTIDANFAGRDMGSVAEDIRVALSAIVTPVGYELRMAGNLEEQERAARELTLILILALVFVYMVMACQYESFRDPLIVMVSVPLAAVGVLTTLYVTQTTLNLQSYIGCIMLGGIVVNNAILLVDQAGKLSLEGMPTIAAVAEAGRRRLRPILMTTLTTVLALIPLALGIGEGADAQAPLARAVVGGLSASTLITLVLIPVVFSFAHPDRKRE